MSRSLLSDSAGGETFTCRLRPFAGGSSWQRLSTLPLAHADPRHRESSAATATHGRLSTPFVAAAVRAKPPGRRPRLARRPPQLTQVAATRCRSCFALPATSVRRLKQTTSHRTANRSRVPKAPGSFRRDRYVWVAYDATCRGRRLGHSSWRASNARPKTTKLCRKKGRPSLFNPFVLYRCQ